MFDVDVHSIGWGDSLGVGITDPNKSLKDVSWGLLKHHLSIIPISEI